MTDTHFNQPLIAALILLGLAVSLLSALEDRVAWIRSFCGFFGEGCRRTAQFTLFGLPIAGWGLAYYLLLGGVLLALKPLLFWVVMAGVGVELTFLKIMADIRAFCIFCLFNAVVVGLLLAAVFDPSRLWAALSVSLLTFLISYYLISRENRPRMDRPSEEVSLENNPSLGPSDAPVTVVEFSDYLCPACRKAHSITQTIREKYEGKIRWVFKDFPLEAHEGADTLAIAARCAGDQGGFWAYQDRLFGAEGKPGTEALEAFASELDFDTESFSRCLESEAHRSRIEADREEGKRAGVSGTPSFIINGKLKTGPLAVKEFEEIIDEELARAGA